MATKYRLERGVRAERLSRSTPFKRLTGPRQDSDQRRMIVLYVTFALFVLALLGFTRYQGDAGYFRQPVERNAGTVVEKWQETDASGGAVYGVRLSIGVAEGATVETRLVLDAAVWQALREGDQIMVVYQRRRDGSAIRVRETGRVALPPALG